jgi:sugar lactone lactonase YvrE
MNPFKNKKMKKVLVKTIIGLNFLVSGIDICQAQNIYRVAGIAESWGFSGDGGVATSAQLSWPTAFAFDAAGNLYIADQQNNRIRKISPTGIISTFAGTGVPGYGGDGGAAINAQLKYPTGVAVDAADNVYIADKDNYRIRKINTSGIISTFAGTGVSGFSGDGGAATSAQLKNAYGITVDAYGNVYFSDYFDHRIRKINTSGIISTIAGTGVAGFSGDGNAATGADLNMPQGIAVDAAGNVYFAERLNFRIRKINTLGIISTFAGTGVAGFSADGIAATSAKLNYPNGIAVDVTGNLYIADEQSNRIRKVNTSGIITAFAGAGFSGSSGDGGPATAANLYNPYGVAVDAAGNVFIADSRNHLVREVCAGACLAGVNDLTENGNQTIIYPNPANASFKIQIDNEISNGEIILVNSIGQKVYGQKIVRGTNEVRTNDLAEGLYNCILLSDGQLMSSSKLIIK